ncbi:MAG: AMP-binding protein, partial [Deltaproteobacteria bacterium]|nr:AMP-binding protein [Deltaproteobacteria bacterium]
TNFLGLRAATEVYFCADLTKIKEYLVAARPHLFFAVPRVWEKFEAALGANLLAATGVKARLTSWARDVELRSAKRSMETGTEVDTFQRRLANKLVISKIKAAIGLDELVGAGSGAAPASLSTLEFFASIGLVIHEGFGMTETTGMATANPLGRARFGTVGQALPGVEIRIAEDGEIMLRGPNMVSGYLYMPEETAELLAEDGWIHTGDLGALDQDGPFDHGWGQERRARRDGEPPSGHSRRRPSHRGGRSPTLSLRDLGSRRGSRPRPVQGGWRAGGVAGRNCCRRESPRVFG